MIEYSLANAPLQKELLAGEKKKKKNLEVINSSKYHIKLLVADLISDIGCPLPLKTVKTLLA